MVIMSPCIMVILKQLLRSMHWPGPSIYMYTITNKKLLQLHATGTG